MRDEGERALAHGERLLRLLALAAARGLLARANLREEAGWVAPDDDLAADHPALHADAHRLLGDGLHAATALGAARLRGLHLDDLLAVVVVVVVHDRSWWCSGLRRLSLALDEWRVVLVIIVVVIAVYDRCAATRPCAGLPRRLGAIVGVISVALPLLLRCCWLCPRNELALLIRSEAELDQLLLILLDVIQPLNFVVR